MIDKITETITGIKDMVITTEAGIGQGKEPSQGVMAMEETEDLAMIGSYQGPELAQIGIG